MSNYIVKDIKHYIVEDFLRLVHRPGNWQTAFLLGTAIGLATFQLIP